MLYLSSHIQYYFYSKIVDMRKGVYGLCGIVNNEMQKDSLSECVFVFLNRRHNTIKLLQWDKDGFALYQKKLEKGTYEQPLTSSSNNDIKLSHIELQHILQGVVLKTVKHKKRFVKQ